jgi:hypothetical protein
MFQVSNASVQGSSTDLGSEYGLWCTHDYGHGFSAKAQVAFYNLGGYYKPTGGTSNNPIQLVAQAKYAF